MGKTGTTTRLRIAKFLPGRIRSHVRVRSPPTQSKLDDIANSGTQNNQETADRNPAAGSIASNVGVKEEKSAGDDGLKSFVIGRKIMIVVDSGFEAKGALLWALSHTVQSHDTVILLHVTKPSKQATSEESSKEKSPRAYDLVNSLKNMSQLRRPEIRIETAVVEGKEKGQLIVEEAKKQGVALLVLGQKKRSITWRLIMMWASNKLTTGGVVEYCIQNADCMAIAVRRKSKKHGGYLITTKRHKDFWLLA